MGSRLKEITQKKPKVMIKVNGISLLEHQIINYLDAGIPENSIHIVVGYKSKFIKNLVQRKYANINLLENKEYQDTNNMYSLQIALNHIKLDPNESVIINNGDCIYDQEIVKEIVQDKESNLIACDKGAHNLESMKIKVENEEVMDISKNIEESDAFGVSIDLYKFNYTAILKLKGIIENYLLENKNDLWTEIAIKDLLSEVAVKPLDIKGKNWVEIDNLDDLREADVKFSGLDLKQKKCFIMDLDGTVYLGNKAIKGTIDFINAHPEIDFYYLTNNTSKLPADYVEVLSNLGLSLDESKIITPIYSLINYLKQNNINNVYFVANDKFISYMKEKLEHIRVTEKPEECECLIVTYDTDLTYEKLKTASLLLQQNQEITYLATHIDLVCPTENGFIPDVGCIISIIKKSTGKEPELCFGKPNPMILDQLPAEYESSEIALVGDRLHTDRKLAKQSGYSFICVLSGETNREDLENLNKNEFPELVVKDLGVLLKNGR